MVRNAKRSMLEELEGMLEIVDPQRAGKARMLSHKKFDLPEGGTIPKEMRNGVKMSSRLSRRASKQVWSVCSMSCRTISLCLLMRAFKMFART